MLNSTTALWASADKHNLFVFLMAVSISISLFLKILLERLCYCIRAGGYLSAFNPYMGAARNPHQLPDDFIRLNIRPESKGDKSSNRFRLACCTPPDLSH